MVFFRLTEDDVDVDGASITTSRLEPIPPYEIAAERSPEKQEFFANATPGSAFQVQHDEYILAFALTVASWMQR